MGTINVYQYATIMIDGRPIQLGSLSEARSITLGDDEVTSQTFKIAAETAVKIWDSAENEAMGGFDFLWIESDLDVLIQCTTGVAVTDAYDVKTLKGSGTSGTMGPALVLGSDVSQLLDGSIDTFDGTADTVGEVWAYNADATEDARLHIVVAT